MVYKIEEEKDQEISKRGYYLLQSMKQPSRRRETELGTLSCSLLRSWLHSLNFSVNRTLSPKALHTLLQLENRGDMEFLNVETRSKVVGEKNCLSRDSNAVL